MLDTNICIELIRGRAELVMLRMKKFAPDAVSISSITLAELQYGVAKSSDPTRHGALLANFLAPIAILPFDGLGAEAYGKVRGDLDRAGKPIGPLDTLIASHALALGLTLVTNNEREFRRVSGLKVENWLKDG
jgi:tRNA(fMet)-specific endonuclease VapC